MSAQYLVVKLLFTLSDTEGSFIVDRVVDIAEAAIKHLKHVAQSCDKMDTGKVYSPENIS